MLSLVFVNLKHLTCLHANINLSHDETEFSLSSFVKTAFSVSLFCSIDTSLTNRISSR